MKICDSRNDAMNAIEAGKVAIVADALMLVTLPIDVVVEATGHPNQPRPPSSHVQIRPPYRVRH